MSWHEKVEPLCSVLNRMGDLDLPPSRGSRCDRQQYLAAPALAIWAAHSQTKFESGGYPAGADLRRSPERSRY